MNSINDNKMKCFKNFNFYYYDTIKEFGNCLDNVKNETNNLINNIFNYNDLLTKSSDELKVVLDKYLKILRF
jgi:hypothetical protein